MARSVALIVIAGCTGEPSASDNGVLEITVSGLPAGVAGTISVEGPNGFTKSVTTSQTVSGLANGTYTVQAAAVSGGGTLYQPVAATQTVTIGTAVPAAATVQYSAVTGSLQISVTGLPDGALAAVTLTSPTGTVTAIAGTTTMASLAVGSYLVSAANVSGGGFTYQPSPASQMVVVIGAASVTAAVQYVPVTGTLQIDVTGLRGGATAALTLTSSTGTVAAITGTTTLSGLAVGTYTLSAAPVSPGGFAYQPSPLSQTVLVIGAAVGNATVQYSSTVGEIDITVTGLPTGTSAAVTVVNSAGVSTAVTGTTSLTNLVAGAYTVNAVAVTANGFPWQPNPASQNVTVTAGTASAVTVQYAATAGALQVNITGVPTGSAASVMVTGPNGFSAAATASKSLSALAPGAYLVAASSIIVNNIVYLPSPASQPVTVTTGINSTANVQYVAQPPSLVLTVDGLYITQAVQRYDFSVPLINDRPGLLRVFLRANQINTAAPDVRVRFYSNGVLLSTSTIHATNTSTPLSINQGDMTASWNLPIAANTIEPGVQVLVDVDPTGTLPLATRANLTWPATGLPGSLDVRASAAYDLTFVPVHNSADGTTGDVTQNDYPTLLGGVMRVHPMWAYTAQVHAPVTFTGGPLEPEEQNGAWEATLQEIENLRIVEGTSRYYYGVVHLSYASGIIGLAYAIPAHSAIGYDVRASDPMQGASETYAHELGHDMGLYHAPGCGAAGPDPNYPYAGAVVGVYGYNIFTATIAGLSNFDLMSYCSPFWISDYSYNRMITLDAGSQTAGQTTGGTQARTRAAVAAPDQTPQSTLLISGSIRGGRVTINPVLGVVTRPVLPVTGGAYRLQGRDAAGQVLLDLSFNPAVSPDVAAPAPAHFNFAVPVAAGLTSLELSGPGIDTTITPASDAILTDTAMVRTTRVDANNIRLQWDATRYPMVLVRDAATGEVLSFARGGDVTVATRAATLWLTASDRIRSRETRIRP